MFLYLLGISLLFHLVYIAVSGVGFLYSGGLWFFFIVEVSPRWVGLDDWLVKVSWLGKLASVFWNWISSLWSAMECPVMSFAMGLCVRYDFGQPVC